MHTSCPLSFPNSPWSKNKTMNIILQQLLHLACPTSYHYETNLLFPCVHNYGCLGFGWWFIPSGRGWNITCNYIGWYGSIPTWNPHFHVHLKSLQLLQTSPKSWTNIYNLICNHPLQTLNLRASITFSRIKSIVAKDV